MVIYSIDAFWRFLYTYIYIWEKETEREREIPLGSMLPPNISIAASTYFEYVKYSKHMNYNRADTIYLCILVLYFLNQEKYNKYIGSIKSGRSYWFHLFYVLTTEKPIKQIKQTKFSLYITSRRFPLFSIYIYYMLNLADFIYFIC